MSIPVALLILAAWLVFVRAWVVLLFLAIVACFVASAFLAVFFPLGLVLGVAYFVYRDLTVRY